MELITIDQLYNQVYLNSHWNLKCLCLKARLEDPVNTLLYNKLCFHLLKKVNMLKSKEAMTGESVPS